MSNRRNVRTIWTTAQEAKLQQMLLDKEAAMSANRAPIQELYNSYVNKEYTPREFVDSMIIEAELWRDILKAFDGRPMK